MKTLNFDNTIFSQASYATDELSINTFWKVIKTMEKQMTIAESGIDALVFKNARSARYTLIKRILGTGKNVLSFHSGKWETSAFSRSGINILYTKDFSENSIKEIIYNQNIGLVYLQTIDSETLAVEDLSHIIEQAHLYQVPVIVDNTIGGLGKVFNPLELGADYVITSLENNSTVNDIPAGAFVVQGLNSWQKRDLFQILIQKSLLNELKESREKLIKPKFLLTDIEDSTIENQFKAEEKKFKEFSTVAFQLSRWLSQLESVMEVNYPGLRSSASNLNAERYSKGGFGNKLKFSLWDDKFSFGLLKGFFVAGKPEGLSIEVNSVKREFVIEIRLNNLQVVLEYFQHVFTQLNNEVNYRSYLSKQLELEQALQKVLSFGVPIALMKQRLTNPI